MASWNNITFSPGQYVSPSTIDAVLDNINVLSIHNHSGSAGEGDDTLSVNARTSNNFGVGITFQNKIRNICHFLPASQGGWGTIITELTRDSGGFDTINDGTMLTTDQQAASGASVAFIIPVSASGQFSPPGGNRFVVRVGYKVSPNSGCITASLIGACAMMTTDSANTKQVSTYSPCTVLNYYSGVGGDFGNGVGYVPYNCVVGSPGLYTLKLQVTGKSTCSGGYGASITGIIVDDTIT